ncbi:MULTISPECIES: PA1414 family protein [Stutzerimonas stutzeri group]|nr:PA1414 family protein [Stutzerimonas degradans]
MNARLREMCWKLAVTLGLVEPPRMQPIPIRAERDPAAQRRR